jgi:hypothetical protein
MRWLFVAAVVVGLVVAGGSAFAGQNANGSISVSPSSVTAAGVVHISGSVSNQGCPQSDPATVVGDAALFPPDGFGPNANRDSQGAFDLAYTVPASTPAATYEIGLRCGGGNVGVTATLRVTADPVGGVATGAGGTAQGASRPWILIVGFGLAGVLIALRRRLGARAS